MGPGGVCKLVDILKLTCFRYTAGIASDTYIIEVFFPNPNLLGKKTKTRNELVVFCWSYPFGEAPSMGGRLLTPEQLQSPNPEYSHARSTHQKIYRFPMYIVSSTYQQIMYGPRCNLSNSQGHGHHPLRKPLLTLSDTPLPKKWLLCFASRKTHTTRDLGHLVVRHVMCMSRSKCSWSKSKTFGLLCVCVCVVGLVIDCAHQKVRWEKTLIKAKNRQQKRDHDREIDR